MSQKTFFWNESHFLFCARLVVIVIPRFLFDASSLFVIFWCCDFMYIL
jgi:hypothetical protein